MIELTKRFKGKRELLQVKNGNYAGYVDDEGNIVINLSTWDGRMADYEIKISGPALRNLISNGMKALDTITGYEHTMQVKVK